MKNITVKDAISKLHQSITQLSELNLQRGQETSRGKQNALDIRIAMKRKSLKFYADEIRSKWKGNVISVTFQVVGPFSILEKYETSLVNMTKDEAVALIEMKFGKAHILEIKDSPTFIKKAGL